MFPTFLHVAKRMDILGIILAIWSSATFWLPRHMQYQELVTRNSWDASYNYIVIGAGSSGSALASRLSEDPTKKVLLLEAGGPENALSEVPAFWVTFINSAYDWQYRTVPQKKSCWGLIDQRARWPRGKIMGGSSSINAMLYVRGNRRDYDQWAREGAYGWDWAGVFPYFVKSENNLDRKMVRSGFHGVGGPLTVSTNPNPNVLSKTLREAGRELGYNTFDFNGVNQTGFMVNQRTIADGRRVSASRAYLHPAKDRPNLHIVTRAMVTKILFNEHKRAIGVMFDHETSRGNVVLAADEIISSAGAVGSPQLLMLSGIGPRKHLESLGIPVVADLPVGRNLQEHIGAILLYTVNKNVSVNLLRDLHYESIMEYTLHRRNALANSIIDGLAFIETKYAPPGWPDIEFHLFTGLPTGDGGLFIKDADGIKPEIWEDLAQHLDGKDGFVIMPTLLRPKSQGYIQLASADPYDMPIIDPKYYEQYDDIKVVTEGIKIAQKVAKTRAFQRYGAKLFKPLLPACVHLRKNSDAYHECSARSVPQTIYHPCCTCPMGDPRSYKTVLDPQLRVKGVTGLRVADISIMPNIVSGNTNAPAMMIGEKAADIIKGKRGLRFLPPIY